VHTFILHNFTRLYFCIYKHFMYNNKFVEIGNFCITVKIYKTLGKVEIMDLGLFLFNTIVEMLRLTFCLFCICSIHT